MNRSVPTRCRWDRSGLEPMLDDMLADPVVELVLKRDGLTRDDVVAVMRAARGRIDRREHRRIG